MAAPKKDKALDWQIKRAANAHAARLAEKIDASFLIGLENTLNMPVKELQSALKISQGIFSKYRKTGMCPDYVLERANKLLASKNLPPVSAAPPASPAPLLGRPPKATKSEQVPSGFLEGIEETLGIKNVELLKLLGASTGVYFTWKKRGYCPVWVRTAINGLMAEKKVINGEAHDTLPRRGRPKSVIALPSQIEPMTGNGEMIVIHVMVPRGQVSVASAMLAAVGYPFQLGR